MGLDWLRSRGIPVIARRTGGEQGLLVRFFTGSGRVLVRTVSSSVEVAPDGTIPVFDSRMIPTL